MSDTENKREAAAELEELRARLAEAEDTLNAIRSGEVDALVVQGPEGNTVYTLTGAERVYRLLVEAMNEGALVLGPDGSVIYSNRTFAAMLGVPLEQVIGSSVLEYVAEPDHQAVKSLLSDAVWAPGRREISLRNEQEESVPAHISVGRLDVEEAGDSISAVVTDLTEHKAMETELEQYREHLEKLVQQRTIQLKEAVDDLKVEIETRKSVQATLAAVNEDLTASNEEIEVVNEELRTTNDELVGQIEKRMQAEAALRWQARLLDMAHDAIIVRDMDGKVAYWNDGAQETYGFSRGEATGWIAQELLRTHFPKPLAEIITDVENGGWEGELTQKCKDGREIVVTSRWAPQLDESGSQVGILEINRDISQRKRIEEELRESQADLNRAQAVACTGSWRLDLRRNELVWSDETYRMFGLPKGTPLTYELFLSRVHPDDREQVDATWHTAMRGGPAYNIEHRIVVDGAVQWVHETAVLEFDEQGQLLAGFGTVQDITERKQAQESLRESEARFRAVFDATQDVIVLADDNGVYVDANPAAEEVFGVPREELLGRSICDFMEGCYDLKGAWEEFLRQGSRSDQFRLIRPDGSVREMEGHAIANVLPGRHLSVMHDVTERRQAEEQILRQSALVDGINRIFHEALVCKDENELGNTCLAVAEELTRSKFSFLAGMDADGNYSDIAVSDLGWSACEVIDPATGEAWLPTNMKIHGIYGRVMLDGECVFTNDPSSHPDSIGLPEGHPVLTAFLGVPLVHFGKVIGMIGLGNREGGYREEDQELIEDLAPAIVEALMRKRAEEDLARARADAERHASELQAFVYSMADGVVLFNKEPEVLLANETVRSLLGPPPNVPYKTWIKQYELRTLEGEPVSLEDYPSRRALRGLETKDERFRMVTPWQESVVSISGSPARDASGEVIGGSISFRDISELVEYERRKDELYQREHRIAEMLQQALMPTRMPERIDGWSVAVRYQPALDEALIGGDFYDIIRLDEDRVGVLIGDVVGKGLVAAVRVAAVRYAVRSYAYIEDSPAKVMALTNEGLCREGADERNVLTAFFGVLDLRTNTLTYANAGHEPPIVRSARAEVTELDVTGPMLGILPEMGYSEKSVQLEVGDFIVLLTDGITEARTKESVLFEKQGVIAHLTKVSDASPDQIAEALLQAATLHAGGNLQDDVAIVVLGYEGSAAR